MTQLVRYVERLSHDSRLVPVRGIFAAEEIAPQARVYAESQGVKAVEVDYAGLKEAESMHLRLF